MATTYHICHRKNLASILKRGLLASKSRGVRKAVWMVPGRLRNWALRHVVTERNGRIEDAIVLKLVIPDGWLRGHKGGLWYCERDIPPSRIVEVVEYRSHKRGV